MLKKLKILDYVIYLFFILFFIFFGFFILNLPKHKGKTVEIYVDSKLVYVQRLQEEEKTVFIPTEIGGVDILFKDNKVRVLTSNSPRQIAVKQGFIDSPQDIIIGIPDKLVVKIIGDNYSEVDSIAK